jgi:hypothetical protein
METSYRTVALASAVIGIAAVLALSSGPAETPNLGEMQEDDEKVRVIVGDCDWAQEFPDGEIRPGLTVKKLNDDIQAVINAFMHIGAQKEDGGEETEAWQTFTNEALQLGTELFIPHRSHCHDRDQRKRRSRNAAMATN